MKDGLTEIVAILDASGSMAGLVGDTIGGYNNFIREQKEVPGEAILSTVVFADNQKVLHNRVNLKDVAPITEKEYTPGGNTASLDAMGRAIRHIGLKIKYSDTDNRPGKVIVFIITDGQENASQEYTFEKVKYMVERQKSKYNGEFMFLGANMDAFSVAQSIEIGKDRAFNYTAQFVGESYGSMNVAVRNYRRNGNVDSGEDYRKRIR